MKINSMKKAIIAGIVYGTCMFVAYVLFTCFMYYLLDGNTFVSKDGVEATVNGIPYAVVQIIAIIISAILPIYLMKCKSTDYYITGVSVAATLYTLCFVGCLVSISLLPYELIAECPLNSFDAVIAYGLLSFPFGAVLGVLMNFFINKKRG